MVICYQQRAYRRRSCLELIEYWDARGEYRAGERWMRRGLSVGPELATRTTTAMLYEGLALMLHRQVRMEEAAEAAGHSLKIDYELKDDCWRMPRSECFGTH